MVIFVRWVASGYKVTIGESRQIIDEILYRIGFSKKFGEFDTKNDAKDLYKNEVQH